MVSALFSLLAADGIHTLGLGVLRLLQDLVDEKPCVRILLELVASQTGMRCAGGEVGGRTWFSVACACFCCESCGSAKVLPYRGASLASGTYCVTAALVEGAHCGVELFDGQRHGGLQRGGVSSRSA